MRTHHLGQVPAADRSRRAASPAPRLHAAIHRPAADNVAASPARPLAGRVADEMQARLGADFSEVHVHTDPTVRPAATEAGAPASAFSPGSPVVIGYGGRGRRGSPPGRATSVTRRCPGCPARPGTG